MCVCMLVYVCTCMHAPVFIRILGLLPCCFIPWEAVWVFMFPFSFLCRTLHCCLLYVWVVCVCWGGGGCWVALSCLLPLGGAEIWFKELTIGCRGEEQQLFWVQQQLTKHRMFWVKVVQSCSLLHIRRLSREVEEWGWNFRWVCADGIVAGKRYELCTWTCHYNI